ncbi:transcriptional regulator [bacterium]|nr:transcriptional regulator [bacterium]
MNSKLKVIEEEFIETIGQLSESLSINRIVGQLYALLFLSPGPLSLDDMVDKLKISKGNASVNIRELERWNAVKKVWIKGERKNFYRANLDVLKIVINCFKNGLIQRMKKSTDKIAKTQETLNKSSSLFINKEEKNIAEIYQDRLKRIKEISEKTENLVKVLSGLVE